MVPVGAFITHHVEAFDTLPAAPVDACLSTVHTSYAPPLAVPAPAVVPLNSWSEAPSPLPSTVHPTDTRSALIGRKTTPCRWPSTFVMLRVGLMPSPPPASKTQVTSTPAAARGRSRSW